MIEAKETYVKNSESVMEELQKGYLTNFAYIVLNTYLNLPKNCKEEFEMWIENVPHFVELLWEQRGLSQIERFNKTAFSAVNTLNLIDNDECMALVSLFLKHATWKDDPSEFGLTEENLAWLKNKQDFQLSLHGLNHLRF